MKVTSNKWYLINLFLDHLVDELVVGDRILSELAFPLSKPIRPDTSMEIYLLPSSDQVSALELWEVGIVSNAIRVVWQIYIPI